MADNENAVLSYRMYLNVYSDQWQEVEIRKCIRDNDLARWIAISESVLRSGHMRGDGRWEVNGARWIKTGEVEFLIEHWKEFGS